MSGTIQRMSKVMGELENRVQELEKSNLKNSLVLTGFPGNPDKRERRIQITQFIKDTLLLNVNIVDSYPLGGEGTETKPMVLVFSSVQERNSVYYNRQKLKEFSNLEDKPFYINEMLPAAMNEKRRREREIVTQNKRNTASKVQMSFVKGNLQIQNETYRKKVTEPKLEDFLKLSETDLNDVMSTKLQPGKQIMENLSTFSGFGIQVTTHQQIRKAYTKLRLDLSCVDTRSMALTNTTQKTPAMMVNTQGDKPF